MKRTNSIFEIKSCWLVMFNFIPVLKVHTVPNIAKPDQTPRSMASELVMQCFLMSLTIDAGMIWVNSSIQKDSG